MNCVSVMLVTYNRLELTKRMLDNLYKTTNVPFRLCIVDNGSTDGTIDWLKDQQEMDDDLEYCVGIDVHYFDKNQGIAIGRNQGLRLADKHQDPWLATVDNDVELPDNWLKECLEIMEANPNYSIGVNMEGTRYPSVTKNGKTFQYKNAGNLGTAAAVFNRRLHQLIGFFCQDFGLYGEEDADFFFRARCAGYQLGYLETMGNHFGVGELDTGEYREFKDSCRNKNVAHFQKNCYDYMAGRKSVYISY